MTLTFKAFNEICNIVMDICGANEIIAEEVAQAVMTIVQTGGVVDDETAFKQLETITETFLATGEVIPL